MTTQEFKRKLSAIFSADVAGYSRLMGEDEAATVRTLEAYKEIMFSLIKQHRGRVIDSPGDNLLAEFASVVDAVQCAVAVQKELQARNADLSETRRMRFRIGINLGDVIEEGDRIYGDGVNIAARLESCADAGGICVSKTAFDHIESKLPLGYEFLGEQQVKNITKPVGAYRVLMDPRVTVAGTKERKPSIPFWRKKSALAGAAAVLIVILGVGVWNFYFRAPAIEPASKEKMAHPLPDKPSIAVLPFVNMSDDPKQDFFSDGITEEIITALSKVPRLFVVSRNATFAYKGKQVNVQQVGRELGVKHVLEGSVRRSGDKLRITAQLIDAATGSHIWAERYDGDMKDVFALQDVITLKILVALQVSLTGEERLAVTGKGTTNLEAYLKLMKAREYSDHLTRDGVKAMRQLAEEAITLDPGYAMAYLRLSASYIMGTSWGWSESPEESLKKAEELVNKALSLDSTLAEGYAFLGRIYLLRRNYARAMAEGERALTMAPNADFIQASLAYTLQFSGQPEAAAALYRKAIHSNPLPPTWYVVALASCYRQMGRYEEAIAGYKKALNRSPHSLSAHLGLAATYSLMGREEDAGSEAAEALRIAPKLSLTHLAKSLVFRDPKETDQYIDALRKAGLK